MPTHLARDDDNTLAAIAAALDLLEPDNPTASAPAPEPSRPPRRHVWLTAGVGALAALAVAVTTLLWWTGGGAGEGDTGEAVSTSTSAVPVGAAVVDGELLGPLRGTSDLDGQATASPGQPVTAPQPREGEATAWQWQLCPHRSSPPSRCQAIGGATTQTWASPPTPEPVWIRVIVTVDIGGAQVQAASDTYRALPARSEGAPIIAAVTPAETWLLDLADPDTTPSTPVSAPVELWQGWFELHVEAEDPGTVTPAGDGYQLTTSDLAVQVSAITITDGTVVDATVCVDNHPCALISAAVTVAARCDPAVPCPGTVVSATTGVSAVQRGTVALGDGATAIVYELLGAPPTAQVGGDLDAVHGDAGRFALDLPAAPPPGATTTVPVTYNDGTADLFVIAH